MKKKCARCGKRELSVFGEKSDTCATCWIYGRPKKKTKK